MTSTLPATPNASPSTATRPTASASATSLTGPSAASTTTTAPGGATTTPRIAGDGGITAEDIFAYTYAVLHDPEYRQKYAVDLLREFPRLPLHDDFTSWTDLGKELLNLHIGFESADPYPLERVEKATDPGKAVLRTNKELGTVVLDGRTTLTGVPAEAWEYSLGNRSALEWVLDQYKERAPRDPTIRERFNTYRFADHKERVIDLLQRVCTISVETVNTTRKLKQLSGITPMG